MKAAVVFQKGELPKYVDDFPAPVVANDEQLLVTVKAVAVKHLDKMRASGQHYSIQNEGWKPKVVGGDAAGVLEDGTRVYAIGATGTIAEKAIIERNRMVLIPNGVSDTWASALPNGVMGSAMALRFRAKMKQGDTVLINGATGFTGRIAVQVARHYGAKNIIATGRNEQSLQSLLAMGADQVVSLKEDKNTLIQQIRSLHSITPIDIVIDYVWGQSAEIILEALKGNGEYTRQIRYITVGAMSGDTIELSSSLLRSTDIRVSGSGLGSWTRSEMQALISDILPEMFQLAATGKLKIETIDVKLKDVENIWNKHVGDGKRLVITI